VSSAVLRGATDSSCAGWIEASAESNAGLESIGPRSAVVFEDRLSGKKGEGRRGGCVRRIVKFEPSAWDCWEVGWKGVDGVGGSGRAVSVDCLGSGRGSRSNEPCANGDCGTS
jgi:hypothetical protein